MARPSPSFGDSMNDFSSVSFKEIRQGMKAIHLLGEIGWEEFLDEEFIKDLTAEYERRK